MLIRKNKENSSKECLKIPTVPGYPTLLCRSSHGRQTISLYENMELFPFREMSQLLSLILLIYAKKTNFHFHFSILALKKNRARHESLAHFSGAITKYQRLDTFFPSDRVSVQGTYLAQNLEAESLRAGSPIYSVPSGESLGLQNRKGNSYVQTGQEHMWPGFATVHSYESYLEFAMLQILSSKAIKSLANRPHTFENLYWHTLITYTNVFHYGISIHVQM